MSDRSYSDTMSDARGDTGGKRDKIPSGTGDHLQSDGGLDDLDEDEMEGTDLLHLISNSLDRFNAIVHPHDLSGMSSGLGASEALLSDLDWSLPDNGNLIGTFKPSKPGTSVEEVSPFVIFFHSLSIYEKFIHTDRLYLIVPELIITGFGLPSLLQSG